MLCCGYKHLAALVAGIALAGCAGSGEGLDANGQPIGSSPPPGGGSGGGITADFQSIQDHVFTPICTQCHIGAGAPQGLQLDSAHSYALLVGVASNEKPSVLRVKAGDPDNSYLLQKLEGASGIVGSQMPLGQTPLSQDTLAAIRQWILNGAAPPPAGATGLSAKLQINRPSSTSPPFAVTVTAPVDGDQVIAPLSTIVVAFNHEVDASLVNDTTVTLEALGGGEPRRVPVLLTLAHSNPSSLVIRPNTALGPGQYRVTVRGTGGGALADIGAQSLATDFSFVFTVSPAS